MSFLSTLESAHSHHQKEMVAMSHLVLFCLHIAKRRPFLGMFAFGSIFGSLFVLGITDDINFRQANPDKQYFWLAVGISIFILFYGSLLIFEWWKGEGETPQPHALNLQGSLGMIIGVAWVPVGACMYHFFF